MMSARNPFFIAICALSLFAGSCGKGKDAAAESEPPTPVEVGDVTRGPIDLIVEADAVLYPVDQASVTSKISAPVKRVLVNRGDHVKAGQLLAELEDRDLVAAAAEARSQYEQAQSALQNISAATVPEDRAKAQADVQSAQQALEAAKKLYENRVELQKQGALAQKLVDDAKVAMVQAQSQYDTAVSHLRALQQVSGAEQIKGAQAAAAAAKAHYDSAAVQVSYAEIRSPINGIVSDRPVYPGEMATSGTPIVSIVNISKVVARANIPLKEAGSIKAGKQATLTSPDGTLTGAVTVVSPSVDPNTTTVEVWVQADNSDEKLKPGGTVHVAIRADLIQDTLLIPAAALLNSDEGGEMVFVVGKDSKAHEHKVTVGIREGPRVQILGGVNEGDKVITSGGLGLDDKAKVTIKEESDDDDDDDDDSDKK
ncbi:MAG TPA: efflux RND transporter periplasmic adaptor subunit [Bryobacteraceae bacterium]|jgi:multidrug efflux pump subunit AcrA (membrane-fusion protein)|nr:efflux RND transporter periplasmic adaptor subunit [Bryobacteraceae bacterium]